MKNGLAVLAVTAAFLFAGCASVPKEEVKLPVETYQYTEAPDICFFPVDKSRWDGYKVTNKSWNRLSDYLKFMYILEGVKELEAKESVIITLEDSVRTIVALNYGVDKLAKDLPDTEITMISFMYDVFKQAKIVKPRRSQVIRQ